MYFFGWNPRELIITVVMVNVCISIEIKRSNQGHDRMDLNYLYNQCLSPLKFWVWIPLRQGVLDTTLCNKFVSDLQQVGSFLSALRFALPQYNWNIVESGVRCNNPINPNPLKNIVLKICILGTIQIQTQVRTWIWLILLKLLTLLFKLYIHNIYLSYNFFLILQKGQCKNTQLSPT